MYTPISQFPQMIIYNSIQVKNNLNIIPVASNIHRFKFTKDSETFIGLKDKLNPWSTEMKAFIASNEVQQKTGST